MNAPINATRSAPRAISSILALLLLLSLPLTAVRGGDSEDRLKAAREREERLAQLNALSERGEHQAVLEELELMTPDETDPRFANLRGVSLAALGRHREAAAVFEAALRRDLQRPELHRNFAISLRELGMTGRAFAEFEEAVRLAPEDAETRLALGESLLHFGRLDRAGEELDRALRMIPADPRVHRARARLGARSGNPRLEWDSWSRVDSLAPGAESARELGRLADAPETSLDWYRRCAERDPSAYDCWARVGELELGLGDPAAAVAALEHAVEGGGGSVALYNLYLALDRAGRPDRIEALLLTNPPLSGACWGVVALSRREAGDPAAALAAVESGRALDPEDLTLANLEGVLRAETGDRPGAEEIWRWILERDPANAEARANLGVE